MYTVNAVRVSGFDGCPAIVLCPFLAETALPTGILCGKVVTDWAKIAQP